MRESSEFYDVKISQEIISEKDKNNLTNMLMKNEETSDKQSDTKPWYNSNCFFVSVLLLFTTIAIATGFYICFIFC